MFFSWKTCSTLSRAEHLTTRCPSASGSSAVPLRSNSNLTGLFLSLISARSSLDTKSCSVARTGLNVRGYDACFVFAGVNYVGVLMVCQGVGVVLAVLWLLMLLC